MWFLLQMALCLGFPGKIAFDQKAPGHRLSAWITSHTISLTAGFYFSALPLSTIADDWEISLAVTSSVNFNLIAFAYFKAPSSQLIPRTETHWQSLL